MSRLEKLLRSQKAAVLPLVAVVLFVLVLAVAITIDISRAYTLQNKAQQASDAALLGAVATISTNVCEQGEALPNMNDSAAVLRTLNCEAQRLFRANFPANYQESLINADFLVTAVTDQRGEPEYQLSFSATIPVVMMGIVNWRDITFTTISRVTAGFNRNANNLELTLVLDTTGSMAQCATAGCVLPAESKMEGLKGAVNGFMDTLFRGVTSLPNVWVSIVPYDTSVNLQNITAATGDWFQPSSNPDENYRQHHSFYSNLSSAALPGTQCIGGNRCMYFQNRNRDRTPGAADYEDVSDVKPNPAAPETLFHLPRYVCQIATPAPSGSTTSCPVADGHVVREQFTKLAATSPLLARSQTKQQLLDAVSAFQARYATRIPVGLMWGWFTLSDKWTGIWPNGDPVPYRTSRFFKILVLMTDGQNELASLPASLGSGPNPNYYYDTARDDATTLRLCEALKEQGVEIYTIAFGQNADQNLMRACARRPGEQVGAETHFSYAASNPQLDVVFRTISDKIHENTLRLTQ